MANGSRKRKRGQEKEKVKEEGKRGSNPSHSLLSSYYPLVLTLREYLELNLPLSNPHLIFPPNQSTIQEDDSYSRLGDSLVAVSEEEAQSLKSRREGNNQDRKWSNWKPPSLDSIQADTSTLFTVGNQSVYRRQSSESPSRYSQSQSRLPSQIVSVAQDALMKQRIKTGRSNLLIFGYKPVRIMRE